MIVIVLEVVYVLVVLGILIGGAYDTIRGKHPTDARLAIGWLIMAAFWPIIIPFMFLVFGGADELT